MSVRLFGEKIIEHKGTEATEVTPQKITWFTNGKTAQSTSGDVYHTVALEDLPQMNFEVAVSVGDGHDPHMLGYYKTWPTNNTVYPFDVNIDYIHFQKFLCADNIALDETNRTTPIDNTTIAQYVYEYVKLGKGVGLSPRFVAGDQLSVRAKQYVELLPGFEVANGADLYIDVHECDR